jgi:hypothetical protein
MNARFECSVVEVLVTVAVRRDHRSLEQLWGRSRPWASKKLTDGHVVIMCIDASIENIFALRSRPVPLAESNIVSHWVVLRHIKYVGDEQIEVSFISNGRRHNGTVNFGVFLTRFFGFVSGSPA